MKRARETVIVTRSSREALATLSVLGPKGEVCIRVRSSVYPEAGDLYVLTRPWVKKSARRLDKSL